MKISVFGLGYVGAVTAGCLAERGHSVIGVDVQAHKVETFNQGEAPIMEPGLKALLRQGRQQGRLEATLDPAEAIAGTELSIVCVGTPSTLTGALDLGFVRQVTKEIGDALRKKLKEHALVYRSTMLPGSTEALVREHLADLVAVRLLQVFYFPEFLREGSAVKDFEQPSLAVVGTRDGSPPPVLLQKHLFGADAVGVTWPTAELVKYACNAFHATKVVFANEIGRLGKQWSVDARRVMELLCQDTRLNLSPYYLRPGNPFGGSCLPKDVRALAQAGRVSGLTLPLLDSILPSNERHLRSLLGLIAAADQKEVVVLGLSFKANTDDLRESPSVEIAQTLLGRGYTVRIYDPTLQVAALVGTNKRFIDAHMPHLASLLKPTLAEAVGRQGVIVAAQPCVPLDDLRAVVTAHHQIIDLNGWPELQQLPARYVGFCW